MSNVIGNIQESAFICLCSFASWIIVCINTVDFVHLSYTNIQNNNNNNKYILAWCTHISCVSAELLNWTKLNCMRNTLRAHTSTGKMWKDSNKTDIFAILCSQLLFRLRQRSNKIGVCCILLLLLFVVCMCVCVCLFFFCVLFLTATIHKKYETANNASKTVIMFGRLLVSVCLSRPF